MKRHLVTFGCSWAYGEGSGYTEGMTQEEYERIQHDPEICWKNGWRKPVVEHFGFSHTNLADYGSSNDRQFRLAKKYFSSRDFLKLLSSGAKVIVLWGTTSVARYDFFLNDTKKYEKLLLNNVDSDLLRFGTKQDLFTYALKKFTYNEEIRIRELELEIVHWNQFFKLFNIQNFWYDTLGSYDYRLKPNNFFDIQKESRSLVSVVAEAHKKESNYYKVRNTLKEKASQVFDPKDDFTYGIDNGVLNSYSYHPKSKYYKAISEYFIEKLEKEL